MRYFVVVYLESFYTKSSGDAIGQGEFYFKCNKRRFPDKGVIKLKDGETFDPEPNPVFFTALLDKSEKEVKFDFEVWEDDVGRDDKFIDREFKVPLKPMKQVYELKDKKGTKCSLNVVLKIEEAKDW